MKTILKIGIVTAIILSTLGCSASRKGAQGVVAVESEQLLHNQAVAALKAKRAVIEVEGEIRSAYLSSSTSINSQDKTPLKSASGVDNYLSIEGDRIKFQFAAGVYTDGLFKAPSNMERTITSFEELKKRNGNVVYTLRTANASAHGIFEVTIQLFRGTNQCDVQVRNGNGRQLIAFAGVIQSDEAFKSRN